MISFGVSYVHKLADLYDGHILQTNMQYVRTIAERTTAMLAPLLTSFGVNYAHQFADLQDERQSEQAAQTLPECRT